MFEKNINDALDGNNNAQKKLILSSLLIKRAVIEADEYDRTLLSLKPNMSVVTNIDLEHIDCYPTIENLKETFAEQKTFSLNWFKTK